jgi:hypothetical protein
LFPSFQELNCQDFCRVLYLDPAGEWRRNNADFMEVMVDELGVDSNTTFGKPPFHNKNPEGSVGGWGETWTKNRSF